MNKMKYQKPTLTFLNEATTAIKSQGEKVAAPVIDGNPRTTTALAYEVGE